jgi:hypothetical protein
VKAIPPIERVVSLKINVRIRLSHVWCQDPEDYYTGIDEIYFVGSCVSGDVIQASIIPPREINQSLGLDYSGVDASVLFDARVEETSYVSGTLIMWDEDFAKDWANRPQWIDAIVENVGAAITTFGGLELGIIYWSTAAAFYAVAENDQDDQLGNLAIIVPATGPQEQDLPAVRFSYDGWGPWSDYDYTVRIHVSRQFPSLLTRVEPSPLQAGVETDIIVHAFDAATEQPADAAVITSTGQELGRTNQPFRHSFSRTTGGSVISRDYPKTDISFFVLLPRLRAWVEPALAAPGLASVVVHAVDAKTGQNVDGDVLIANQKVANIDERFEYFFDYPTARVCEEVESISTLRQRNGEADGEDNVRLICGLRRIGLVGRVRATGYEDQPVVFLPSPPSENLTVTP